MHQGDDYIVSLVRPNQVGAIATALSAIDKQSLRTGYSKIDASDYQALGNEDFDYTWNWFDGLADFYTKAAAAGRAVIFTVDQ